MTLYQTLENLNAVNYSRLALLIPIRILLLARKKTQTAAVRLNIAAIKAFVALPMRFLLTAGWQIIATPPPVRRMTRLIKRKNTHERLITHAACRPRLKPAAPLMSKAEELTVIAKRLARRELLMNAAAYAARRVMLVKPNMAYPNAYLMRPKAACRRMNIFVPDKKVNMNQ